MRLGGYHPSSHAEVVLKGGNGLAVHGLIYGVYSCTFSPPSLIISFSSFKECMYGVYVIAFSPSSLSSSPTSNSLMDWLAVQALLYGGCVSIFSPLSFIIFTSIKECMSDVYVSSFSPSSSIFFITNFKESMHGVYVTTFSPSSFIISFTNIKKCKSGVSLVLLILYVACVASQIHFPLHLLLN